MKFEQLIADASGSLRYGLDAAGNIWALRQNFERIEARSVEVDEMPSDVHSRLKCSAPGCPVCASGLGHE